MIMRSLSLPDPELRCNMLEVLTSILEVHDDTVDEVLHAQAKSLVEKLLVIAVPEEGIPETAPAVVRLVSLTSHYAVPVLTLLTLTAVPSGITPMSWDLPRCYPL